MRIGISLVVLLSSILSSQISLAAPQEETKTSLGSENGEKEPGYVDLEGLDRDQVEKVLYGSKHRLGWGITLTILGLAKVLLAAGVLVYTAATPAPPNGPLAEIIIGSSAAIIGSLQLLIGIPLWISGHKRKKHALEKLSHMPSVSFATGGEYNTRLLTLSWRF